MELKTIFVVVFGISILAWFTPTPNELREDFRSGQDFYAAKDYRQAIQQYDHIIEAESGLLEEDSIRVSLFNNDLNVGVRTAAYYQKGNAFRSLGRNDSAIVYYRVVEQREDSPKLSALAQYQIYEIYYADSRYKEAIEEARVLIDRHPLSDKIPQAWYDIGWSFRVLEQPDSSAAAFKELISQYPEHPLDPRARYQVAETYFQQRQWNSAIHEFGELIRKYRPESFAQSEWENVELKALKERMLFEAMSEKDVDLSTLELTAKAQVRIGDAFREQSMYDSAMANYQKVITTFTLLPSLVEATYIKMAEYTAETFDIEAGIAVYREAIDESFSNRPLQAKLQYKVARTYQEYKLYVRAAEAYLFYAQAYPGEADGIKFPVEQAFFLAVSNWFNAKEYTSAIHTVDSMFVLYPSTALAAKMYLYRGLSQAGLFKFDEARMDYNRTILADPASNEAVLARTQLGKTYLDERDYKGAIAEFEILLEGNRDRIDVSEIEYYLGLSLYGSRLYDEAVRHLLAVEPASTYYPYTFARITRAYISMDQADSARSFLAVAEERASGDSLGYLPFVRLARAEYYTATKDYQSAIVEFDAVIDDNALTENTRMQALYGRGMLFTEMERFPSAVADLSACLESAVFQQVFTALVPPAKERLAFAMLSVGRPGEGERLLQELVDEATSEEAKVGAFVALTEFQFRRGEYRKAIRAGINTLRFPDASERSLVRVYVTMSTSHGNLQEHELAIERMVEAARRFPNNAFIQESMYQLALLYYKGGDYDRSARILGDFRTICPTSALMMDVDFTLAMSLYAGGRPDDAIAAFRAFLSEYPDAPKAPEARLQIAETYFNTSRFPEAAAEYGRVYRDYPNNANAALAMFNEGWTFYQEGHPERMVKTFMEMIDRFPGNSLAGDAAFSIGDYHYNNRRYDSALLAYENFLVRFPEHHRIDEAKELIHELNQVEAYAAYEKAMVFFDEEQWDAAIRELTTVMERFPQTDIVYGCKANIASAWEQLGESDAALQVINEILTEWRDIEAAQSAVFFAELHKRWIEAKR